MMRRREFIALAGSAAAWPFGARAQQAATPTIGWLDSVSPQGRQEFLGAFTQGLAEKGYKDKDNVVIEYRWAASGQYDLLPGLAAEFVTRRVSVIFANGGSAPAAKTATATIPIVFMIGRDPVREGIVDSLSRPGKNITGFTFSTHELAAKRIRLMRDLVPKMHSVAVLINPNNPDFTPDIEELEAAAHSLGLEVRILKAATNAEIENAFASLAATPADALFVNADAFFSSRRDPIVALAARHALPAVYPRLEYAASGGLLSYATALSDLYHRAGDYVGRILNGERPGDLPVQQPTKFELVINLETAKALGLEVPVNLLALADKVIE